MNLSLKSAVSELLLYTKKAVYHHLLGSTSYLNTLCIALFCDFYHFLKLIICINCYNLRNFYDTQKFFQHLKVKANTGEFDNFSFFRTQIFAKQIKIHTNVLNFVSNKAPNFLGSAFPHDFSLKLRRSSGTDQVFVLCPLSFHLQSDKNRVHYSLTNDIDGHYKTCKKRF